MGLSTSKQLCEMMQGDIWASSEVRVGSTFSFKVMAPPGKIDSNQERASSRLKGNNVLLLDPDLGSGNATLSLLESWGLNVVTTSASSSNETPADLTIIDRSLIEQDLTPRKNVTIEGHKILLTSDISEFNNELLTKNSYVAQISKPINHQNLHQILSLVFSQSDTQFISNQDIQSAGSSGLNILLVEDNLINQEVAKGIIEDFGYVIDTAENGQEALDILSKPHQLMDCQMPITDGYEATKKIRDGKAGEHNLSIPIIAMTANAMKGDEEKCLAIGMDDYLAKPLNILKLEETLLHWSRK